MCYKYDKPWCKTEVLWALPWEGNIAGLIYAKTLAVQFIGVSATIYSHENVLQSHMRI